MVPLQMPSKKYSLLSRIKNITVRNRALLSVCGSFEGWIRRIFVNTAIEHFRKKTYLQPITEQEESTLEGKYISVLDNLAEKDIVRLIQQLSPGYRTVFNMYVVEGYTHKQIAEALNISEGTSKSQLSRAKLILQDLVKKHLDKRKQVP